MATRKAKGGKKLTQLSRKRRKPAAPRSRSGSGIKVGKRVKPPPSREKPISGGIGAGSPQLGRLRRESGAAISPREVRRALRAESGAAISDSEIRAFLRFRKTKGK